MTNQNQEIEIEDEDLEGNEGAQPNDKNKGEGSQGQVDDDENVDDLEVQVAGEETQRDKLKTRSEERRFKKNKRNKYRQRDQEIIRQQQNMMGDMKRQMDEMAQKLDAVAGATDRVTAQNIDDRIHETQRVVDAAKRLHAEAIASGDAEKASQAMEDFAEARDGLNALKHYKSQLLARKAAPREDTRQGPVERSANNPAPGFKDKAIERKFKEWHRDNPWYDVKGSVSTDPDSRLAYGMDTQLEAEGYDPATDEYWEELDSRLRKKLPHHYRSRNDDDEDEEDEDEEDNQRGRNRMNARDARQEIRRKPPTGGSPKNVVGQRKTITISAERASAMREMGYQPGTAEWKKMAKKYAEYDKQHNA